MKKKITWFIFHIIAIVYFSYMHVTVHYDAAIPFIYLMLLLSFPLGFAVPFIFIPLSYILPEIHTGSNYLFLIDIVLSGILFMFIGYLQWFILLPKIRNYFKKKTSPTHQTNKSIQETTQ